LFNRSMMEDSEGTYRADAAGYRFYWFDFSRLDCYAGLTLMSTHFLLRRQCTNVRITDPMTPPNVSHRTSVYVAPRLGTKLW
jgi:hypothetical protein